MKKKFLIFVGTFILVYICNFFIPRMMPGDPFNSIMEDGVTMSGMSEEQIEKLSQYYGLDKPLMVQFRDTIVNNLHGNFGQSIFYKKSVSEVISERFPWTMYIMFTSLTVSLIVGVLIALLTMGHKKVDTFVYHIMSFMVEIPSFLVGVLFLFLVAANVKSIPLSGCVTAFKTFENLGDYLQDVIMHSLMPVCTMIIILAPQFYFISRSSFLDVIQQKYVLQARAKGLKNRSVLTKYILLNAVFPIIACFFMNAGNAIGGTLLVENVFAYPGLGTVIRDSVRYRDYALIQTVFLVSTAVVMSCSYLSDIINYFIGKEE